MSANTLLITGTDSGVGKTFVAAGLARTLKTRGHGIIALKPVESGCGSSPSATEDGVILANATGQDAPRAAWVRLSAALAPPVAADLEQRSLPFDSWCDRIRVIAAQHEITLVEGAGGLLSPLTWNETALDLAQATDARALVVASNRLGCLNHTLLTLRILEAAKIKTVGVVLSDPEHADLSSASNRAGLERVSKGTRLLELSRTPSSQTQVFETLADWVCR